STSLLALATTLMIFSAPHEQASASQPPALLQTLPELPLPSHLLDVGEALGSFVDVAGGVPSHELRGLLSSVGQLDAVLGWNQMGQNEAVAYAGSLAAAAVLIAASANLPTASSSPPPPGRPLTAGQKSAAAAAALRTEQRRRLEEERRRKKQAAKLPPAREAAATSSAKPAWLKAWTPAPKKPTSKIAAPKKIARTKTAPKKAMRKKIVPKKAVPKKIAQKKTVPKKATPSKKAPIRWTASSQSREKPATSKSSGQSLKSLGDAAEPRAGQAATSPISSELALEVFTTCAALLVISVQGLAELLESQAAASATAASKRPASSALGPKTTREAPSPPPTAPSSPKKKDNLERISRHFDRAALTRVASPEECLPELVFAPAERDATLHITSSGHIKVGRETMDDEWVKRLFFNATELRLVNFSMETFESPPDFYNSFISTPCVYGKGAKAEEVQIGARG
ncbi:MAG: hypothetical protein SGPRY_002164, partial [Prymnesium sp.]